MKFAKRQLLLLQTHWPEALAIAASISAGAASLPWPEFAKEGDAPALERPNSTTQISVKSPQGDAPEATIGWILSSFRSHQCGIANLRIEERGEEVDQAALKVLLVGSGAYGSLHSAVDDVLRQNARINLERIAVSRRQGPPNGVDFELRGTVRR